MIKTRHLLATFALLFLGSTFSLWAQTTVTGILVDAANNEPLIGASIQVEGSETGTTTDVDGKFTINSKVTSPTLLLKYIGYSDKKVRVSKKGKSVDLGTIEMEESSVSLGDVVITSSVAVARKTPVALSTISPLTIETKLGTQEFPEILKSTPGVHANKQGGGYGDSEIYMRGFDPSNIAVMINGVPINDMEWGGVYWSNWAGLGDVTRSTQTQRGLGASKVSAPSVGGTINIVTAGTESKQGGSISYAMGNDGFNKILFNVSTGMSNTGWSMTLLGGKTWGEGYVQGTDFEGYNYFLNISKRINYDHTLSFTVFGAPQTHYQRNSSQGLTVEGWDNAEKYMGDQSKYRYNPSYGFDKNGQRKSANYNEYHKPQISLNHQWRINDISSLSTSAYVSIGRGNGYSGEVSAYSSYSYTDWYGSQYGTLKTTFRKADGTFDYGAIQTLNEASETGSEMVMTKSRNYHDWYGLLSTYTTKWRDFDIYGGIDFRYYKGTHTNVISDLYNGEYFVDASRGDVLVANNANAANNSWVYEKLGVGDVVYRDYDSHVMQEGAFFQAEYNKDKIAAFIAGSLSNTTYWRYDRFYYDKSQAESETVSYIGFTAKGGANYNLNENHNVFANIGVISRAPKFSYGAFLQSTSSNTTNPNAVNEKIFSVELGYGFHNEWASVNLNAYYTKWMDKTMTKSGEYTNATNGIIEEYQMNMEGVDALHKGVELEVKVNPFTWLELTGMLSIGDWEWDSNATGYCYNAHGQPLKLVNGSLNGETTNVGSADHAWAIINLDGIKVGGSAQTTAALGASFKLSKQLRFNIDYNYLARNYAYYALSGSNLTVGKEKTIAEPWKIPDAGQIDLSGSYNFKIGTCRATLSGTLNNLLGYEYISKAFMPSSGEGSWDTIYGFYQFGRTYSVRLKINF